MFIKLQFLTFFFFTPNHTHTYDTVIFAFGVSKINNLHSYNLIIQTATYKL